jgi:hypothetical protein
MFGHVRQVSVTVPYTQYPHCLDISFSSFIIIRINRKLELKDGLAVFQSRATKLRGRGRRMSSSNKRRLQEIIAECR